MFEKPPKYHTYILRIWEERNAERKLVHWRFTLEDPAHNVRHGFASLEEVAAFLHTQTEASDSGEVSKEIGTN